MIIFFTGNMHFSFQRWRQQTKSTPCYTIKTSSCEFEFLNQLLLKLLKLIKIIFIVVEQTYHKIHK